MPIKPQRRRLKPKARTARDFDYSLDYDHLDLRAQPDLYRVGRGEQGVLSVEPYRTEIVGAWRFRTPEIARTSAKEITKLFRAYKKADDFIGMDMARKFLQMGYTRARRYANHKSGRKYDAKGKMLKLTPDKVKAAAAEVFYEAWQKVEADRIYAKKKAEWKERLG